MAKNSAKSKGFRKTIKQKPFITKKEIIELVVILVVIALAVVLFNIFYDDGFIKANKLQPGDVVSYASTDLRDRYKKVATIGEIEGFTLAERNENDTPIAVYTFTPDAPVDNIESISVNGSFVDAGTLVGTTLSYMSGLSEESSATAVQEVQIQNHDAMVYSYTYSEYDANYGDAAAQEVAEGEEPAHNKFTQVVSAYISVDETHTLCFHIYRRGGDESFHLAEDQLVDFVEKYSTAFVLPQEA